MILALLGALILLQVLPEVVPASSPAATYAVVQTFRLAWLFIAALCLLIGLRRKDAWIANAAVVVLVVTLLESCMLKTYIR